jgi:hypothetical protein
VLAPVGFSAPVSTNDPSLGVPPDTHLAGGLSIEDMADKEDLEELFKTRTYDPSVVVTLQQHVDCWHSIERLGGADISLETSTRVKHALAQTFVTHLGEYLSDLHCNSIGAVIADLTAAATPAGGKQMDGAATTSNTVPHCNTVDNTAIALLQLPGQCTGSSQQHASPSPSLSEMQAPTEVPQPMNGSARQRWSLARADCTDEVNSQMDS